MSARESKRKAIEALKYMADHYHEPARGYGYAWSALARIAGLGDPPMPGEIGPPKPEHAVIYQGEQS